jgi:hypothetical protein
VREFWKGLEKQSPAVGAAGLKTIALDWVGVGGPAR